MTTLIHLSPIFLVMTLLILLRRPPVQAAVAGAVLVAMLWLAGAADTFHATAAIAAILDTAVLFASTAFVIVPGLAFVILVERLGVNQALSQWVQALSLGRGELVVFIVLGLAPLLEAMTGFGVSLIATVPLLLSLFERRVALRIALTGMAVMPWGTLGLATVIGASLAHLDVSALAAMSAFTSAPVFVMLTALALWRAGARGTAAWGALAAYGLLFVGMLYALSRWLGPEVAGVGAGLVVAVVALSVAAGRREDVQKAQWPRQAWPYLGLIVCIVLLKGLGTTTHWEDIWLVRGVDVIWKPLASPGVALVLVALWVWMRTHRSHRDGAASADGLTGLLITRARRPLLTIFCFLVMAQMMVKAGFLDGLVQLLSSLPTWAMAALAAVFGALSGYMTGSNVGGNAIFMPAIALLAESSRLLLAAVQNSAAGHAALGSLPIVMLVLSLAKTGPQEEGELVRFGFGLVCLNTALVALAGCIAVLVFG